MFINTFLGAVAPLGTDALALAAASKGAVVVFFLVILTRCGGAANQYGASAPLISILVWGFEKRQCEALEFVRVRLRSSPWNRLRRLSMLGVSAL
jgi:hypothetical protein